MQYIVSFFSLRSLPSSKVFISPSPFELDLKNLIAFFRIDSFLLNKSRKYLKYISSYDKEDSNLFCKEANLKFLGNEGNKRKNCFKILLLFLLILISSKSLNNVNKISNIFSL